MKIFSFCVGIKLNQIWSSFLCTFEKKTRFIIGIKSILQTLCSIPYTLNAEEAVYNENIFVKDKIKYLDD